MSNTMQHQATLEVLFNKSQIIPRLQEEVRAQESVLQQIRGAGIPLALGVDILVQLMLHRRATTSVLVGVLRKHLPDDLQFIADCLWRMAEIDLIDYDTQLRVFTTQFEVGSELQETFDRYQYPLPMVIPPRKVVTNTDSGYLSISHSIILRDNHTEEDVCLDHINRLNSIQLQVNMDTANMIQNKWKSLDKKKSDESMADYQKRKKQFLKYDKVSRDIMDLLYRHGTGLYLTHRYDSRGRTYCQGYHVNYMGTAWNKAVIEFAEAEHLE